MISATGTFHFNTARKVTFTRRVGVAAIPMTLPVGRSAIFQNSPTYDNDKQITKSGRA